MVSSTVAAVIAMAVGPVKRWPSVHRRTVVSIVGVWISVRISVVGIRIDPGESQPNADSDASIGTGYRCKRNPPRHNRNQQKLLPIHLFEPPRFNHRTVFQTKGFAELFGSGI